MPTSSSVALSLITAAVLAGALLAGCTTTSGATGTPAPPITTSPEAGPNDGAATRTTELICLEIFDCAGTCPDADLDACSEACLARGSATGRSAATALATCYETNGCGETECLKEKCGTELAECATQKPVSNEKPIDKAPPGTVPVQLVGTWQHFYSPTSHVHDFTFNADGTASEYITTASSGFSGCKTSGIGDSTGTVVFTDTTMTYYKTAGTDVWNTCGKETIRPTNPSARAYSWSFDGSGQLVLVDQDNPACIDNPTDCAKSYAKK